MREVTQATYARRQQVAEEKSRGEAAARGWGGSLHSFVGRLHWHCHFMQKLEDQPDLEFVDLHPAYRGLRDEPSCDFVSEIEARASDAPGAADLFRRDAHVDARFEAWAKGEMGWPFADACMRYLQATGWLNFRMRAMMVAVASYHLWLPWRRTGLHLARLFTDYEPGIHWPQTQMQSGTTGINTPRIYNPIKQGQDQDPAGLFVRRWCPELADVPTDYIHTPWLWEGFGRRLEGRYPLPIVDHMAAARLARERIWAVRRGGAYRATAQSIQERHGSRKSGISHRGQRPSRGVAKAKGRREKSGEAGHGGDDPSQLDLEF